VTGERSPEEIQREIEQSRAALAATIDQLAYRGNPKRLVERGKEFVHRELHSTRGRIVIGVAGGLVVLVVVRRITKH
jgi:hypothetical protein